MNFACIIYIFFGWILITFSTGDVHNFFSVAVSFVKIGTV